MRKPGFFRKERRLEQLLSQLSPPFLFKELPRCRAYGESGKRKQCGKKQNCMVQVADLLRSNGIRWSPQAKSPRRPNCQRTRSEASRAAENTKPQENARSSRTFPIEKFSPVSGLDRFFWLGFRALHDQRAGLRHGQSP